MTTIKIGLEVHCQLNTKTKIFCHCPTMGEDIPNSRTCQICLGHPGSKPLFNKEVMFQALKVALALNCKINKSFFFSRKTYFYPDMPKDFQITQYEIPIAEHGSLDEIRIKRIHMEEDPGKLVHKGTNTLIDYNRSGVPLIEIVTEPDIKSPEQARAFLNKLITILEYLNVYERKSETSLRADVNISINNGKRAEVKNVNGVKEVERVLKYEIERQKREGQKIQETRHWDPNKGKTIPMRKKETEEDYGYIFEPDLTEITLEDKTIETTKKNLPELADERAKRYIREYLINEKDATVLTQELILAELFEKISKKINPQLAAKWLQRDLLKLANYNKKEIHELDLDEDEIINLLELVESKKITDNVAKDLLIKLLDNKIKVKDYIEKEKLVAVSDKGLIEKICKEVIKENPQAVDDYKKGNAKALHFIVGKVMAKTRGAATPEEVNNIIKKLI